MDKRVTGRTLRFHGPYHFVALPLAFILFVWSLVHAIQSFRNEETFFNSAFLPLLALCLLLALSIVRRYATKTQDRIVRLEEQFRYFRLTGKELNPGLSVAQIIALRNSADGEFPALCERAAAANWSPAQIRSNIGLWRSDTMRI